MRRELYLSGGIHAALILWVAFGDLIFQRETETPFQTTGVRIISLAEFEAMTEEMALPMPEAEVEAEQAAAPAPEPEATPEPEAPSAPPPPEPIAPPLGALDAPVSDTPTPEAAPRVAPTPAPPPPPEAEVAPEVVTATPDPVEAAPAPVEEATPAAPEEAATQIVTEAETPSASAAPVASAIPVPRPARPTPPDPVQEDPAPDEAVADAVNDAVADAVAAAVAAAVSAPAAPSVPSGPPLSQGEIDGLIADVRACWNIGALSSEAQRTIVTIAVSLTQASVPEPGSIRMIGYEGGSAAAAAQAFEAGRRAILRCGATGFGLPQDKYDQWREIEMVFNPEQMRLR